MKVALFALAFAFAHLAWADITVYTDRPQARFANAAQAFEQQTGEKVVFVEMGYKDILAKLQMDTTPADVVITKDIVYLAELTGKNLLQPMAMTDAVKTVRPFMREPNLNWVGLTFRARSVIYDPSRVNPADLTTYEDLASSKWAGRLCLRTGKAAYNEALVAGLIANQGEEKAKEIVSGWIANLATDVMSDDNQVIEAITQGTCDIGIVNHYYLAQAIDKSKNLPVRMAFMDQNTSGVLTNGAGMGLVKGSAKAAVSQKFIDILLSKDVQLEVSRAHLDYPIVDGLLPDTFIADWGTFKINDKNWNDVGTLAPKARAMISEVGYP